MLDRSKITVALLSAGLGTRLRPITDTIPKVMVSFDGTPLLEHTILLLRDQGFRKFVVNLHYLPQAIIDHFGNGERFGVEIIYTDEREELLETGGGLKKMESHLSDTFIVVYGDHLHFYNFRALLDFHERHNALATLVLKRSDLPANGDIAEIDPETNRITVWHPRPHDIEEYGNKYYLNSGLEVFSKRILDFIPPKGPVKLDAQILPLLIKKRTDIYGLPTEENILDIGTPEKYEFAKNWYREQKNKNPGT